MRDEEKLICDFMHKFVEKNWDKIRKGRCEIKKSCEDFLKEVGSSVDTALWVLTEICDWGMDERYLEELYVELPDDCDFYVIKIKNKYIKLKWNNYKYEVNFCIPKKKTVIYFE